MLNLKQSAKWRGAAIGFILAVAPVFGAQAAYPDRPIHMVVPFAAGSNSDLAARQFSPKFSELLGQTLVLDNRGGGSGIVGADLVAKAAPDGYTILFGTSTTQAINPSLFAHVPYDPIKNFASIARLGFVPMVLVVNKTSPINSVADLVAYAKAHPGGQVKYSTVGIGTVPHLAGALFDKLAGIDTQHVPYSTTALAYSDLIGGLTTYMFYPYQALQPQIASGQFRPIAMVSPQRVPWLPNLPTMIEQGYPGFVLAASLGLYAPKNTPQDVLDVLSKAAATALNDPELRKNYLQAGTVIAPLSPADTDKATLEEIKTFHDLIVMTGAKNE